MHALSGELQLLKPDIIACQECFVSEEGNADTLKFLAEELGMNCLFANGRSKKRNLEGQWVDSMSGLGVLSVYPVTAVSTFSLPASIDDNDRKAQQVAITLSPGNDLLLTNIHLTHLNDRALRNEQAGLVADRTIAFNNYNYKIICGDFNAEVGSGEVISFINRCNAMDCYSAGKGVEPRYSLSDQFKQGKKLCVDHIFALPFPGTNTYPQFINSAIVLNEPGKNDVYPSDHFGITATLVIN